MEIDLAFTLPYPSPPLWTVCYWSLRNPRSWLEADLIFPMSQEWCVAGPCRFEDLIKLGLQGCHSVLVFMLLTAPR